MIFDLLMADLWGPKINEPALAADSAASYEQGIGRRGYS
jgi:hypothetical protein